MLRPRKLDAARRVSVTDTTLTPSLQCSFPRWIQIGLTSAQVSDDRHQIGMPAENSGMDSRRRVAGTEPHKTLHKKSLLPFEAVAIGTDVSAPNSKDVAQTGFRRAPSTYHSRKYFSSPFRDGPVPKCFPRVRDSGTLDTCLANTSIISCHGPDLLNTCMSKTRK